MSEAAFCLLHVFSGTCNLAAIAPGLGPDHAGDSRVEVHEIQE
jgi:hypothetical protein